MTRAQIRANVRSNLADAGITFYDDTTLNDAIQDAYNEVASKCRCIVKSATVAQVASTNYYDFSTLGISDYLGCFAIFNTATNFWLRDDLALPDFDRIRRDWELWTGAVQFWTPHSFKRVAVAPYLTQIVNETFVVWYWATAPILTVDSDTFLIATDMQEMLEMYATADKLEDSEELAKAEPFWKSFEEDKQTYLVRCQKLAAAQLLQRV